MMTSAYVDPAPLTSLEQDLQRARQLATMLDAQFEVAGVKFGLDSIVGLVPGIGDALMLAVGTYPLVVARRHRLGNVVIARMAGNLLVDWAVGSVPAIGDIFDVWFKAHLKNLDLLEKAAARRSATPR